MPTGRLSPQSLSGKQQLCCHLQHQLLASYHQLLMLLMAGLSQLRMTTQQGSGKSLTSTPSSAVLKPTARPHQQMASKQCGTLKESKAAWAVTALRAAGSSGEIVAVAGVRTGVAAGGVTIATTAGVDRIVVSRYRTMAGAKTQASQLCTTAQERRKEFPPAGVLTQCFP